MLAATCPCPAFVSGWEFPGQKGIPEAGRRFEVVWSVDPPAVQDAAMICARLARSLSPGLEGLEDDLPSGSAPASADLHRAMGLLSRMTGYLDKQHR